MFLINSRLISLAAAHIAVGRPYSEVTAAVLPSSLTRFLSYTLGYSPHPPVSVWGTDTLVLALEVFLGTSFNRIESILRLSLLSTLALNDRRIYLPVTPLANNVINQITLNLHQCVTPSENQDSAGILTSSSIDYAFRPRLRTG